MIMMRPASNPWKKNEEHARLVFKHAETSGDDKDKKT
jgi:hypothetical protein